MKNRKGFTLIEILIVVVILAILAAMILPRFLGQTESAYVAEAQQSLGVLRRAQVNHYDTGAAAYVVYPGADAAAALAALGLSSLTETNFTYTCDNAGACTATRKVGTLANGTIAVTIGGVFSCDGTKYALVDAGNTAKGCRVNA